MWTLIKNLAASGTTILLTTQYMDEADYLADWIVVIDEGRVIAEGDANSLKARVGSDHVDLVISKNSSFSAAQQAVDGARMQSDPEQRVLTIAAAMGRPPSSGFCSVCRTPRSKSKAFPCAANAR